MFKHFQKLVQQSEQEHNLSNDVFNERLRDKPFWIWDVNEHRQEDINTKGDCCFNHIVGLPKKDGIHLNLCVCMYLRSGRPLWLVR
jgi:hypothetical protein